MRIGFEINLVRINMQMELFWYMRKKLAVEIANLLEFGTFFATFFSVWSAIISLLPLQIYVNLQFVYKIEKSKGNVLYDSMVFKHP